MVFATGAITGIHPIRPGQRCRVDVQGGPSVELRTADARTLVRSDLEAFSPRFQRRPDHGER
jgi:hypothetical protein